jgi:hypothetical protein
MVHILNRLRNNLSFAIELQRVIHTFLVEMYESRDVIQ